jgi:methylamine dehydrogenase accessory protein MauD
MSSVSQILLWMVVIVQSILILGLLREVGLIQLRVGTQRAMGTRDQGLAPGSVAPDVRLEDALTGEPIRHGTDRARMLVFLDPTCGVCHSMVGPVGILARAESDRLDVTAVCGAPAGDCREFLRDVRPYARIASDPDDEVKRLMRVSGSSFAIVVDRNNRIGESGIVNNLQHLESLLDSMTGDGNVLVADPDYIPISKEAR